jgi:hypothetical protein
VKDPVKAIARSGGRLGRIARKLLLIERAAKSPAKTTEAIQPPTVSARHTKRKGKKAAR